MGINYWHNLLSLFRGGRLLRPLAVAYYLTTRCNLNCGYCEDFGLRRNGREGGQALPLDAALQILRVIRGGSDTLILTGGEPLLYPEIDLLVRRARHDLKFRGITLLTNGLLLPQHEALLPSLDRLVLSLDSTDPQHWQTIINAPAGTAQAILEHVRAYAGRHREFGYQMIVNCVLSPDTLASARQLLDFCTEHELLVSFSPQAVNNWPRYDLLVSAEYRDLLEELLLRKRRGAPILGSSLYLKTLLSLSPYSCYPTLVPRVMPNGDLVYPCRPIEREGNSRGGRPCNLLQVESWELALQAAVDEYDSPPRVCSSCFQQCFAEPSLMQSRPLAYLGEWLRYSASRRARLPSYAPG